MRIAAGVVVGYLTFAIPVGLMFYLSGHKAHEPASVLFMVLSTAAGVVFATAAGFVAVRISDKPITAMVLAVFLAAFAIASMFSAPSSGRWSQMAAVIFMAPAVLLGGRFEKTH